MKLTKSAQQLVAIICLIMLASCASTTKEQSKGGVSGIINRHMSGQSLQETERRIATDNEEEEATEEAAAETVTGQQVNEAGPIQLVENEEVNKWINYFSVKDRERFQRMLNRGEPLREVVQNILAENGLPKELYYLALIESGYVNHARSHANAVGVWQFIKGTGKRYGLEMNNYVDERQDPIRATEAAARYLRGLYNVFQSWELVMAAYNCGEYRVLGSVMRSGIRNYWTLIDKGILPRETRDYVPKFMAAVIIGLDPEKYGFKVEIQDGTDYPSLELVDVPSPVSISKVAQVTGVDAQELKRFNPHLRKGITPPGRGRYELWIPQDKAKEHAGVLAAMSTERGNFRVVAEAPRERSSDKENNENGEQRFHTVRRGENLAVIAAKYNQTVSHLKKINYLSGSKIRAGQRLRLTAREYHASKTQFHRVRRGENLTTIARLYGTTVPRLKQLNKLSRNGIQRGQRLVVSGQVARADVETVKDETSTTTSSIYRVKRGDTLHSIARRFKTTIAKLRQINGLKGRSIYVGQALNVVKDNSSI